MDRSRYRCYRIPKKSGGWREIVEPDQDLKQRQKTLLKWLMARRIRPSPYAHGFVKRRSTATHARLHTKKLCVIRLDLKDFFPTITDRMVEAALVREGIKLEEAKDMADLCTLDGKLPQGAPTSPFLSNLVFRPIDYRLAGLARKWDAVYSRYADDLIFSTSKHHNLTGIIPVVKHILTDTPFRLNSDKTRVYRAGRRQLVTGIVVNEQATLPREERRKLRAAVHNSLMQVLKGETPELKPVEGMTAYLQGINEKHARIAKLGLRDVKRILNIREAVPA